MFGYKSIREQLVEERRKNAELEAFRRKDRADLEFVAMMTDVELDEDEVESMEVSDDE